MAPPKGSKFWKARSTHGRKPIYESPDDMWDAAEQYFQWVEDNPLIEHKVAQFQGEQVDMTVEKMRAMTIGGCCRFIGMNPVTLAEYEKKDNFSSIVKEIRATIYDQKLVGAAADLLNSNIIARELQLGDKQTITVEEPPSASKRKARIDELLDKCAVD